MDIASWLHGLGLQQYELVFRENAIDASVLPELTAEDLKDLGVSLVGHRRKLLAAISAMRSRGEPQVKLREVAATSAAERRQLTVMFCDLVGSTGLAARLDPEDLREVIATYHRAVAKVIAEFDGFVAKYMGDGVLVYFGYPRAHEDDAELAVRSGLGVIDAVGRLEVKSVPLQARVGIATGLVVVGDLIGEGSAQEQSVVGETPNLAARLQALADPSAVVIAAGTRRLVGDLFEYRDLGAVEVKGIAAPVPAWQVLRPGVVASRFEALRGPALSPLIGRDEEIDLLLRRWGRAKAGDGQVVLISGEPGLGKSRIAATLEERLQAEPHIHLRYFCSPYHQESALFPFINQVGRAAGFTSGDPPLAKLEKLEALLTLAAPPDEDIALFVDLLSLPASERHPLPNLSPQRKKERTLEALLRQLEGLARHQPVVTVFEDAHWIDPTSRELLDLTAERVQSLPVLLIVTFRPEFQPNWIGEPQVTMLPLNRLDRRVRTIMIDQIADGKALPQEVMDQIVDRTDGVPLFVEELTKSVLESGLLREERDRYVLDRALPPFAIPTSLHDSLMARLDRLTSVRHVAQIGAAIGRQFSHELIGAVASMPPAQLDEALTQLVSAELIYRRGTPPDAEYTFKHALVQDTAYSTLLRGRRQQLHASIAATLERRFPDVVAAQPALLAHHCGEAGMTEKAVAYWLAAGRQAWGRSATAEAVGLLQRGLALVPALLDDRRQETELDLRVALGQALIMSRSWGAAELGEVYSRARELALALNRPRALLFAMWGQFTDHWAPSDLKRARQLAAELRELGDATGDIPMQVMGCDAGALVCLHLGEFTAGRVYAERGAAGYDPAHRPFYSELLSHDARVDLRIRSSNLLACLGHLDQALRECDAALEEARRLSHPPTLALALAAARWAVGWYIGLEPGSLLQCADELLALATDHGLGFYRTVALIQRGWCLAALGRAEQGIPLLTAGLAGSDQLGIMVYRPRDLARLGDAFRLAGEWQAALEYFAEARRLAEDTGNRWYQAETLRLIGDVLATMGDRTGAEGSYHEAIAIAQQQSAKLWELHATVSLARLWRDQGRRAEARDLLAPIYGWFTEGFDTPDLKEAKALLEELG